MGQSIDLCGPDDVTHYRVSLKGWVNRLNGSGNSSNAKVNRWNTNVNHSKG